MASRWPTTEDGWKAERRPIKVRMTAEAQRQFPTQAAAGTTGSIIRVRGVYTIGVRLDGQRTGGSWWHVNFWERR